MLKQIVHQPTQNGYLLDLAFTDVGEAKAATLAYIADHRVVQVTLKFAVPKNEPVKREVWEYGKADWQRLEEELQEKDWSELRRAGPDEAAYLLTQCILDHADQCIGRKMVCMPRSSHPWLNDRALAMVQAKTAAEGTAEEKMPQRSAARSFLKNNGLGWKRRNTRCIACDAVANSGGQRVASYLILKQRRAACQHSKVRMA